MFGYKGVSDVPYLGVYLRGQCGLEEKKGGRQASLESSRQGSKRNKGLTLASDPFPARGWDSWYHSNQHSSEVTYQSPSFPTQTQMAVSKPH